MLHGGWVHVGCNGKSRLLESGNKYVVSRSQGELSLRLKL